MEQMAIMEDMEEGLRIESEGDVLPCTDVLYGSCFLVPASEYFYVALLRGVMMCYSSHFPQFLCRF